MRWDRARLKCAVVAAGAVWNGAAHGATVWITGPNDVIFTKPFVTNSAVATQPLFQDHITGNVWLARADFNGLFNIKTEPSFNDAVNISPADTEWAFSGFGTNPTFTYGNGAAAHSSLVFTNWEDALGSAGQLQTNITTLPGVVHLITDDIYFDIHFTDWGSRGDGRFTYQRAGFPGSVASVVWDGSVGNWTTGAKWTSTPAYPDNGAPAGQLYTATIGAGDVTLDTDIKLNALTMTGGTLSGSKILTLNSGTIGGSYNMTGLLGISGGNVTFTTGTHTAGQITTGGLAGNLIVGAGATLTSGTLSVNGLTVNGRHNLAPGSGTSTIGSLTLAGTTDAWTGKLDVNNGNLIISSVGGGGGLATVTNQIKEAAALGTWTGTGGITSSAAQASASTSTAKALACVTGDQFFAITGNPTLGGKGFAMTDVLVTYTLAGDGNLDGSVTFADFLKMQNNYNQSGKGWTEGDWNYDGSVTFSDFLILQNNYNKVLGAGAVVGVAGAGAVPEPGSLMVLAVGGMGLLRRRRAGGGRGGEGVG